MKKTVLIFALTVLVAFSAFGASAANYYPVENSGTYSYTVRCDVSKIDGIDMTLVEKGASMYGLVAVKGTGAEIEIEDADDFVYIDQATVDENGIVTFSGFLPMGPSPDVFLEEGEEPEPDVQYFEECTLFIGGAGLTTATYLGELKDASGVEIAGTVTDTVTASTSSKVATITVYDSTGEQVGASATTDADGKYTAFVPAGEDYKVVFTKPGFLSFTYTGVNATTALAGVDAIISNLAGDVDGNGEIKIQDIQTLLKDYNATSDFLDVDSDVDAKGEVKIQDIQALLKGYNGTNVSTAFSAE